MPQLEVDNATIPYQILGDDDKPAVMLVAGLGGAGITWGPQVAKFAERYRVVLPDQRGTGQSSRPEGGHTIAQNARDMAAVLRHAGVRSAHIVGSSTGGAIAQLMALDHGDVVRSLTLSTSFARAETYMGHRFSVLRYLMAHADMTTVYTAFAMILFAPQYAAQNPQQIQRFIDYAAQAPAERDTAIRRIDMVLAHDALERLNAIRHRACIIAGEDDVCTPLSFSEELASSIPGAALHVLAGGGHLIHMEQPDRYFELVASFIDSN